jgi:hypothetical protein
VVGSLAAGFDPAKNQTSDVIYTEEDSLTGGDRSLQYFWEAFPAGSGPTDRTTCEFEKKIGRLCRALKRVKSLAVFLLPLICTLQFHGTSVEYPLHGSPVFYFLIIRFSLFLLFFP